MSKSRAALCLVLVSGSALLAGCGASVSTGGDEINRDDAAKIIEEQYPEQAGGLKLTSIECDGTEPKVDNTFTCTGENDAGVTLDFESTITEVDEEADKVGFDWTITKAVSDGTVFNETAQIELKNQGYAVDAVDCPEITIAKGEVVDCEVTMDDGSKQDGTLTLTDDNGGFNIKTSGPKEDA